MKNRISASNLPSLAQAIRSKGQGHDKVLAHINPEEARFLERTQGGSINPHTGLPQYGLFSNPKKWFKSIAGPTVGTIVGNMLLPGVGGIIGGALGGAAGSAARGRHDMLQATLRGAGIGTAIPAVASLAGSGAKALDAKGLAASLSGYGSRNAILPALGIEDKRAPFISGLSPRDGVQAKIPAPVLQAAKQEAEKSFLETLSANTKNFLTEPRNLLTLGTLGVALANRPKAPREKSPEQLADEQKRLDRNLRLTPAELRERERYLTEQVRSTRRVRRNRFMPEEYFNELEPLYVKSASPEEYKKTGRWLKYYSDPDFTKRVTHKKGGEVSREHYSVAEMNYPSGQGYFLSGSTDGQADNVPAMLSDGEYVIPADVVAHLGDGNNKAGAKKLDMLLERVRKTKNSNGALPQKSRPVLNYLRG